MIKLNLILVGMSLLLQISCLPPKRGDKSTNGLPAPSKDQARKPTVAPELIQRASEIHTEIVKVLEQKFPYEKNRSWASSKMDLADDFVVESPKGLWGQDASKFPTVLDCNTSTQGCDEKFKRMACETQTDCVAVGTTCQEMASTVSAEVKTAKKLCMGPSDHLVDRFYNVMVSAEHELDIVSLSMPDGRFRTAMNHALSILSTKPNPPTIRLLFSGFNSGLPNLLNPPQKILDQILKDVEKIPGSAKNLKMNLAWLADGKISWNHAKIIVADGKRALTGGHNMWDGDYLKPNPIFDLSLDYTGKAAERARDFANVLWEKIGKNFAASPAAAGRIPPHSALSDVEGTYQSINVGRLGSYGDDPSEAAIIAMINAAKSTVMIHQQDFYNVLISPGTRTFAFNAIIDAAVRGVKVHLIQSNTYPLGAYGMINPVESHASFHKELVKGLMAEKNLSATEARTNACERLIFSPFRISGKQNNWPNHPKSVFGTHTKLVMVDSVAVYVGSHNLYPCDLQEYGNIIVDAEGTKLLKEAHWDKVWKESSQAQQSCPQ